MFELDDQFLTDIGIINMPEPARGKLIQGIQKMVQDRVTIELSNQLTDEIVEQLEQIGTSKEAAENWLAQHLPQYATSAEFEQFKTRVTDGDPVMLFAQTKWIDANIPNFPAILLQVLTEVKGELKTINGKVDQNG
jgi:hypothetical protein